MLGDAEMIIKGRVGIITVVMTVNNFAVSFRGFYDKPANILSVLSVVQPPSIHVICVLVLS